MLARKTSGWCANNVIDMQQTARDSWSVNKSRKQLFVQHFCQALVRANDNSVQIEFRPL